MQPTYNITLKAVLLNKQNKTEHDLTLINM